MNVTTLRLNARLTQLSPPALDRLLFGFSSIRELTLDGFNGNQLTDKHLHECGGSKGIQRLEFTTGSADAGPLA
ncbi:hypothetical protein AAVH_33532, partial [Aphelenchoides avenae]